MSYVYVMSRHYIPSSCTHSHSQSSSSSLDHVLIYYTDRRLRESGLQVVVTKRAGDSGSTLQLSIIEDLATAELAFKHLYSHNTLTIIADDEYFSFWSVNLHPLSLC